MNTSTSNHMDSSYKHGTKECKYINEQLVTYMTFTIGLMWCSLQENHTNLKTHKVSSIKRYLMQMITNWKKSYTYQTK